MPRLLRVRCDRYGDEVTVRMLPGHFPDDWAKAAERLAYAFRLRDGHARSTSRPDRVVVRFLRRDPLAATVDPLPVPDVPVLGGLVLGVREDGLPYLLRLAGSHVLVAGATNAGKGSVLWSLIRSPAGGVRSGLVEVWAFDPKGGMELAAGAPLLARFVYHDPGGMAGVLEEAVKRMPMGGRSAVIGEMWWPRRRTPGSGRKPGPKFDPDRVASPLAGRPYDQRHAGVSLWLNAALPGPEVAQRAGHSVDVLLKVYAKCLDETRSLMNERIETTLRG